MRVRSRNRWYPLTAGQYVDVSTQNRNQFPRSHKMLQRHVQVGLSNGQGWQGRWRHCYTTRKRQHGNFKVHVAITKYWNHGTHASSQRANTVIGSSSLKLLLQVNLTCLLPPLPTAWSKTTKRSYSCRAWAMDRFLATDREKVTRRRKRKLLMDRTSTLMMMKAGTTTNNHRRTTTTPSTTGRRRKIFGTPPQYCGESFRRRRRSHPSNTMYKRSPPFSSKNNELLVSRIWWRLVWGYSSFLWWLVRSTRHSPPPVPVDKYTWRMAGMVFFWKKKKRK